MRRGCLREGILLAGEEAAKEIVAMADSIF